MAVVGDAGEDRIDPNIQGGALESLRALLNAGARAELVAQVEDAESRLTIVVVDAGGAHTCLPAAACGHSVRV